MSSRFSQFWNLEVGIGEAPMRIALLFVAVTFAMAEETKDHDSDDADMELGATRSVLLSVMNRHNLTGLIHSSVHELATKLANLTPTARESFMADIAQKVSTTTTTMTTTPASTQLKVEDFMNAYERTCQMPYENPGQFNLPSSHAFRRTMMCRPVYQEDLSCPRHGIHHSIYNHGCAHVPEFEKCVECGWETRIGNICPSIMANETKYKYGTYKDMPRGREQVDGESGAKHHSMQRVRVDAHATIGELYTKLEEHSEMYLPHYWQDRWLTANHKTALHTFGPRTIMVDADFAAVISHEHDGTLNCSTAAHSNCEVLVVNHSPEDVRQDDGTYKRTMKTDCWFFIGGTLSKHKEADSYFHNVALNHVVEHYKELLGGDSDEELTFIVCTDGCAGKVAVCPCVQGRYHAHLMSSKGTKHETPFPLLLKP